MAKSRNDMNECISSVRNYLIECPDIYKQELRESFDLIIVTNGVAAIIIMSETYNEDSYRNMQNSGITLIKFHGCWDLVRMNLECMNIGEIINEYGFVLDETCLMN